MQALLCRVFGHRWRTSASITNNYSYVTQATYRCLRCDGRLEAQLRGRLSYTAIPKPSRYAKPDQSRMTLTGSRSA